MGKGWKAIALLREGKLPIKNFGVAFCGKRPHIFLPEILKARIQIGIAGYK
jgi:hypothetical protein